MALLTRSSTIRGGFFRLPGGGLGVIASGPFKPRALVLTARVGEVPVVELHVSPTGGSFTGRLSGTPQGGDVLFVRYPPEPEVQTNIRFQLPTTSVPTRPVA
jgi:hypothetical protein